MKKLFLLGIIGILFATSCSPKLDTVDNKAPLKYTYTIDLNSYANDQVHVELQAPKLLETNIQFCFPKIVPGIYGAMDFGQYISSFKVFENKSLELKTEQMDVNCWKILNADKIARIEYDVDDVWEEFNLELKEGFYRSAASNFDEDVFLINPNCLFGYFRKYESLPVEIEIIRPENLYGATSLSKLNSKDGVDKYYVENYQKLVDNPMMYASADTTLIKLPNIEVEVACFSTSATKISKEIADYIAPLLKNQTAYLNGKLPVNKYTFIIYHNLNPDENSWMGDGLEHGQSTVILLYMPMNMDVIKQNVYGIASHEFFHTLMPLGIHSHEIADYDFNNPKFSRHLWLYEGMTEYFTIHMPIKTAAQNLSEFLTAIEQKIAGMQEFNNSLSFTELSLNAMDMQDQYYNVYLKGSMICLSLDIYLRELSQGEYGTQDLVLDLLEKYGTHQAFEDEALFDEIIELTGYTELRQFFDAYVIGADPLPLETVFDKVGFQLENGKLKSLENLSSAQKDLRKYWINQ